MFSTLADCHKGIIGVFVTGFILEQTNNNWVAVFMLTASLCAISLVLWLLFAKTEVIDFDREGQFVEIKGDKEVAELEKTRVM